MGPRRILCPAQLTQTVSHHAKVIAGKLTTEASQRTGQRRDHSYMSDAQNHTGGAPSSTCTGAIDNLYLASGSPSGTLALTSKAAPSASHTTTKSTTISTAGMFL